MNGMIARGLTVAMMLVGTPALATQYAVCLVLDSPNYYASDVVEIEDGSDASRAFRDGAFPREFAAYVESRYDARASDTRCYVREYKSDAVSMQTTTSDGYSVNNVMTGWNGGRASAIDRMGTERKSYDGVVVAVPGAVDTDTRPANSDVASANTAADMASAAAERARTDALTRAENERTQNRFAAQQQANAQAEAKYKAEVAAWEARKIALDAEWKQRVAACKAGDYSQCATATQQ